MAGESPARIVHEDDDVLVIHNVLNWVPVMLLAMPRRHMTQEEMWRAPVMARVAEAAVRAGKEHCPRGFRLLSNFGPEAMQSQPHAHLHVLGRHADGPLRVDNGGRRGPVFQDSLLLIGGLAGLAQ